MKTPCGEWSATENPGGSVFAARKTVRAAWPEGKKIFVILNNLSARKGVKIRIWAGRKHVELCFAPIYSSWANPIESRLGTVARVRAE